MASRLGLRLAARSMRQPAILVPRVGQRAMSSGPVKESSDTAWIAAAAIGTVGGLALIYSPSGNKSTAHHAAHATTPQKNATKEAAKEKEDAPPEKPKEPESKADENKPEGDASPATVQASVKQSMESDGDPASAKAEEAKEAESSKSDGDKPDSESDEGFVKISAEDAKEALKQENVDVPAIAKNEEEEQAKK